MKLLGATGTHVGNVREVNQDRVFFRGMVAALADGMGGHQGGERAAELAITQFQGADNLSEGDLVEVVMAANRQVHGHAADNGLPGMGTTLVAMTLHDDESITVANVGDSRAYWLRGDYMGQVTEDHSFVEDLVRQGRLTPEEAATHPQRNILTRAVGIGAEVEVDRFPIPEPAVGDRFLLCSDGLFNELTEEEILEILLDAGDPADTARALIAATLETPCRDNVTVAVVDVVADDDPRLAAAQLDTQEVEPSKPITAPVPVVSTAVLKDADADGSSPADDAASEEPVGLRTATLVRADEADADDAHDPERFLDTAEMEVIAEPDPEPTMSVRPRSRSALGLAGVVVVVLALAAGYFLARDHARSGYFVAETETTGELVVFQGRRGGFLIFDPMPLPATERSLGELDDVEQSMLEAEFSTRADAEALIVQIDDRQATEAAEAASDAAAASSDSSQAETTSERTNLADSSEPSGTAGSTGSSGGPSTTTGG